MTFFWDFPIKDDLLRLFSLLFRIILLKFILFSLDLSLLVSDSYVNLFRQLSNPPSGPQKYFFLPEESP